MSDIFSQDQGNQGDTQTNEPTGSWLEKVVADKGDKFRDPEELAKSVFNANLHIKSIEEELAEARANQAQADYAKTLLEELRKGQQPASGEPTQRTDNNTGGTSGTTTQKEPEDIKKLVEEAIAHREHTRSRDENLKKANDLMVERFGDQAVAEFNKRSQALGLDKDSLMDIAAKSPTAFLSMLGEAPKVETNRQTGSTVNTASFSSSNSGKRDWRYYQDLRKSDPKAYRSPRVQTQMERDYAELGDKFWG